MTPFCLTWSKEKHQIKSKSCIKQKTLTDYLRKCLILWVGPPGHNPGTPEYGR